MDLIYGVLGVTGFIVVVILVCLWFLGTALMTAWIADQKGRNAILWFFLGLIWGIIALLSVGLAPMKKLVDNK